MSGALSHSPAAIIQQCLVDLGLGDLGGSDGAEWPVFVSILPPEPENSIAVFDTDGRLQGRSHTDGEVVEKYGFQVRVRAGETGDGYVKAKTIWDRLTKNVLRREVELDADVYVIQSITPTGTIIQLGQEAHTSRFGWTFNAIASIRLTETTGTGS